MTYIKNWHPNFPANLENCQSEPIHIPGAVQGFGFLIAFDEATREIRAVSENALEWLPQLRDFQEQHITLDQVVALEDAAVFFSQAPSPRLRQLVKVSLRVGAGLQQYFGVLYQAQTWRVLEIEPHARVDSASTEAAYLSDLSAMMSDIQSQRRVQALADFAAAKVKELTGFDRVMVYRYDAEWNGEVISEAKAVGLETFLGLHYPASDIPAQARALYEKNWIRIIPDVNYRPSFLLPESEQGLDLSTSVLRSVSPIHIQYLRNMGVGASMSISLMIDGKLWGLIACHHYSPHYVPLNIRLGCEAYGQLISWHIRSLEAARVYETREEGEATLHRVLKNFSEDPNFREAAMSAQQDLLNLFGCTGIIIRLGEESVKLGVDTGDFFPAAVAKALIHHSILEPLATHDARAVDGLEDADLNPEAVGFMALALAPRYNYYIICTRPEQVRSIHWAGNPHTKGDLDFTDPKVRLAPRGSFALWEETHRGRSEPWSAESLELLKRFGLLFVKIVIERMELTERNNAELKAISQAKDEFVAMVSHELRTPLNAIIGWTELALSGELHKDKFGDALKIIQRNARSQNQLVSDLLDVSRIVSGKMKLSVRNMRVSEVVESVVLSFTPAAEAKNIKIVSHLDSQVDSVIGDPNRLQQVVWNLLSNAVKFSAKGSRIWISVRRFNSQIELQVRDEGVGLEAQNVEKIFGRFHQVDSTISRRAGGLGLGLSISKHIVELHGGRIQVTSEGLGRGACFSVLLPIAPVQRPETRNDLPIDDHLERPKPELAAVNKRLSGEVILVVEDEPDAAKFLEMLLAAHGAKVYLSFNGEEALDVIDKFKHEIGIVLSDVGMPRMDGYQLMRTIRASEDSRVNTLCAIALTAFGRTQDRITALQSGFDSYIAKPVMQEELITVLESACKTKKR